jgi:hypothetical protein
VLVTIPGCGGESERVMAGASSPCPAPAMGCGAAAVRFCIPCAAASRPSVSSHVPLDLRPRRSRGKAEGIPPLERGAAARSPSRSPSPRPCYRSADARRRVPPLPRRRGRHAGRRDASDREGGPLRLSLFCPHGCCVLQLCSIVFPFSDPLSGSAGELGVLMPILPSHGPPRAYIDGLRCDVTFSGDNFRPRRAPRPAGGGAQTGKQGNKLRTRNLTVFRIN